MTQEDKQLLLKDLCARLPYGIICQMEDELIISDSHFYDCTLTERYIELFRYHKDFYIKPYLRPLSSMTEEEKRELQSFFPGSFGGQWLNLEKGYIEIYECESTTRLYLYDAIGLTEWLNKKMFDYRGLIPKGLANSTEKFNPYKN